jgi:hypothetical protein
MPLSWVPQDLGSGGAERPKRIVAPLTPASGAGVSPEYGISAYLGQRHKPFA